jgi:hypothetical protein
MWGQVVANVIQYFTQLPDTNGYTTIMRTVTLAAGLGTFDYGVVPQGTQLVAAFASDQPGTASPVVPANTNPRLNGTLIGFGRSDVAAPVLGDDWAPYTFTCQQQGILTIDFDGGAAWGVVQTNLYLYVYIPQQPCP